MTCGCGSIPPTNPGASSSGGGIVAPPASSPAPTPSASAPTSLGPSIADVSDRLRTVLAQVNALLGQTGGAAPIAAPAPVGLPAPAPAAAGYIVPGRQANGSSAIPATGATPGLQLTTPADKPLVDAMLAQLRTSATGSQILSGIDRIGAKVTVLDDAQFTAAGHAESSAYYDPPTDTMFVRRSQLQAEPRRTAATFAHEATHALDDVGQVGTAFVEQATRRHAAAGTLTPAMVDQIQVEYSLAKEARGFTIHATVMRELGEQPQGMLADVVRTGANDRATYEKIFGMLVAAGPAGGYNTTGTNVAPFEL